MNAKWWHNIKVSAYWSMRAVSASEAAQHIHSFGARLATLDPIFDNLRGLRATGAELMNRKLEHGAPTEEEALRLFAKLEEHAFFLRDTGAAELEAELVAQAKPQNPERFASTFTALPSKARYCAFVGETHSVFEPTSNYVEVEIPFENSRAVDVDLLSGILDASIEAWDPRTSGIYGVWHDTVHNYESHSAYWLHWRAPGVIRESWTDAQGQVVSRGWPEGTPAESRPHLGGTLDIYPQHRPELLAAYAAEGRPPD